MTCAKKRVICRIYFRNPWDRREEQYVEGTNDVRNPQPGCPRKPGEGYSKCKDICQQEAHAEIMALNLARGQGVNLKEARAELYGIDNSCKDCQKALAKAGLRKLEIFFKWVPNDSVA